jgi:hypothetical protein
VLQQPWRSLTKQGGRLVLFWTLAPRPARSNQATPTVDAKWSGVSNVNRTSPVVSGTANAATRSHLTRASSSARTTAPKLASFGAIQTSHRTTRWPNADTYRRRPLSPKGDVRSLASISIFDCDPPSKVAPPPEAFNLLEPCLTQQILVPSGRGRNKHAPRARGVCARSVRSYTRSLPSVHSSVGFKTISVRCNIVRVTKKRPQLGAPRPFPIRIAGFCGLRLLSRPRNRTCCAPQSR